MGPSTKWSSESNAGHIIVTLKENERKRLLEFKIEWIAHVASHMSTSSTVISRRFFMLDDSMLLSLELDPDVSLFSVILIYL
jgi:hypothetical protein